MEELRHGDPPGAGPQDLFSTTFWPRCLALRPRLASYLRALLPDHHAVDDCLQETYLLMADRYQDAGPEDLAPLAFTCARNKARSWLAKHKVGRLAIIDPELMVRVAEAAARPSDERGHDRRVEALRECLDALKPADRELIDARYGSEKGRSVAGLASRGGMNSDALYKKLERLRGALKRCVGSKLPRPE